MLRFDGKVVVITGAGGGLGKAYALSFAERGAKVVVNDLGASHTGQGASTKAADFVVEEIKAKGGEAVANYDSVQEGDKIIDAAIKAFGRVDILLNNAGILRDVTFARMTDNDWDLIDSVHVKGTYKCTKAAWPHMLKNGFGRIVNTTSAAGLYGNFGQVNYSAAKSAVLGFTYSCATEGARKNVFSNVVAPLAGTRMTETVMPKDILESLKPSAVVPVVMYMCHESSGLNGQLIEAGAGWYAKTRFERSKGAFIPDATPEDIQSSWAKIVDFSEADHPTSTGDSIKAALTAKRSKM